MRFSEARETLGTSVSLSQVEVYFGEGAFLMEYNGVQYDGDQDLFDHAEQEGDANGYEEWLRINCSNNQWGWLYMSEITLDDGTFVGPNITEYGTAKDLE